MAAVPASATGSSDTAVSAALSGLTPNTTYYYRIVATNSAGTTNGAQQIFTTSLTAPLATTNPASAITSSAATLNGTVNPRNISTTVTFEYGLTPALGTTVECGAKSR